MTFSYRSMIHFFSSACFVQLHLARQLRWSLWAIPSWCRDGFSCAVTMGQRVGSGPLCHPSVADYLHQVWQAESDGLNVFCVIDPQEPEFPQPPRRTWRRQGRCSSPGWSNVPPARAGTCSPGSWLLLWAKQCMPAPMQASRLKSLLKLFLETSPSIFPCVYLMASMSAFHSKSSLLKVLQQGPAACEWEQSNTKAWMEFVPAVCSCQAVQSTSTTGAKPPATKYIICPPQS